MQRSSCSMAYEIRDTRYTTQFLCVLAVCYLAGCGATGDVKTKVDDDVYRSIDRQWKDDFGPKANYRVSDVAASPNDVQVEKALPDQLGTLTLPQAVALATGRNRAYQKQREDLYIRALDLRLTREQFEQRYFGLLDAGYQGERAGYRGMRKTEIAGTEAKVGFNRLLANGTRLSANLAGAWEEVLTGNLRGGLTSVLGVAVTKPLLRGSSREVVMEGLTQAERDVFYEVRTFNQFRKALVVSVISDYYHMLVLLDRVQNAKANHQALVDLLKLAVPLAEADRIPAYEADRVRQDILQAEKIALEAQRDCEQMLDQYKLKLGISTTIRFHLDAKELEDLKASPLPCPDLGEKEIIDTALARRLDLANEADRMIDTQRNVAVAKDRLRAELNLVASADLPSSQRADRHVLRANKSDVGLGLEASLPFSRVAEENEYRLALLEVNRQQRQYDLTVDTVTAEVRQSYRKLKESAQRYQICRQSLELAQQRVQNTTLLLRHGRANTRRVLDAQGDLCNAQDQAMKALADYATATLEFYRDTGVLRVRPDGMWEL